jgi:L-aminopeptidase/D-esterase-like protein
VNAITDVPGMLVGHADDADALTGCTVVLCPPGTVGGVDQRGGAPGTRELDALRPMRLVQAVHGVVLAGGSAFGLDAASGVMRWLEEHGIGYDVGVARVPIVPAMIVFDLGIGRADVRPDAAMGYRACAAASAAPPRQGNAGAGLGCTVGKLLGPSHGMKGGLGTASEALAGGLMVGALVAVNALGDVVDPSTGQLVAGARLPGEGPPRLANSLEVLRAEPDRVRQVRARPAPSAPERGEPPETAPAEGTNTVIGVVATNARLSKEEANFVATMAHDGLARTIRPAHTLRDGDTIVALATGERPADVTAIGALAAEALARAVLNGVRAAESVPGWPAASTLLSS